MRSKSDETFLILEINIKLSLATFHLSTLIVVKSVKQATKP